MRALPLAFLLSASCAARSSSVADDHAPSRSLVASPALTCEGRPLALGPSPMRRLSREEYRNSISDLFGVDPPPASDLPEDVTTGGFGTTAEQRIGAGAALEYFEAGAHVAAALASNAPRFFPCAVDELDETACVRRFLTTTGSRIYRRRLTGEEREALLALFARTRAAGAVFAQAAATMVQAMLTAPAFLFLGEPQGPDATPHARDSWQVAARLSYLLWRTTPDAVLLDAAARDELRSPAAVALRVRRMLADDRARRSVSAFFAGWLGLDRIADPPKENRRHPEVNEGVIKALALESQRYSDEVFWRLGGKLETLLVSSLRMRNEVLSKFYGDALGRGADVRPYEGAITERSFGLLSQAGLLMAAVPNEDAAIIHRGKFLRRRLLCAPVTPPPPGVLTALPKVKPGTTARERIEEHTGAPSCYKCHGDLNPPGFALEHFDGTGRWRDLDGDQPIDATAELDDAGIEGTVDGALDLSRKLARSPVVQDCVVRQLFEDAIGRAPEERDECVLREIRARFRASGGSLPETLVAVAASGAMLVRAQR